MKEGDNDQIDVTTLRFEDEHLDNTAKRFDNAQRGPHVFPLTTTSPATADFFQGRISNPRGSISVNKMSRLYGDKDAKYKTSACQTANLPHVNFTTTNTGQTAQLRDENHCEVEISSHASAPGGRDDPDKEMPHLLMSDKKPNNRRSTHV